LHGFDRKSYIKNTRHDVFDKVVKNLRLLVRNKNFRRVLLVVTKHMAANIDKIYDFIVKHIPKHIGVSITYRMYETGGYEDTRKECVVLYKKLTDLGYSIETHHNIYSCDDLEV